MTGKIIVISPTYTAQEILQLCLNLEMEYSTVKILVDIWEEEADRYTDEDLIILLRASVILFTRSMLKLSLKNIE